MKTNRDHASLRNCNVGSKWLSLALAALLVASPVLLWPVRVEAATILDPNNPGLFQREGTQPFAAGATLTLADASSSDFINFFTFDNDAAAGTDLDVIATFRVTASVPVNADAGNRVVINDGVSRSAIAACIVKDGVRGIGLYSSGSRFDPSSYPVFVPVDWQATPVRIRLRRHANGDAEIMEINGVAPSPRALLPADMAPANTRAGVSVEFGSTVEAECTVEYRAFRVVNPASETLVDPTTLSVANASGVYGESTNLSATLMRSCDLTPVPNSTVSFTLNGMFVGSATTDGSGVAVLPLVSLAGIDAGAYPAGVGASFAGDSSSQPSSNTGPLTVAETVVGCDTAALIAAIDSANSAGGGTLELSSGCTYTLTQPSTPNGPNGLPPITTAITIHGNGATITRAGTNPPDFRIFEVDSNGTLAIDYLTVSGGSASLGLSPRNAGGGIFVDQGGDVTITQSTISRNSASTGGGISNSGTVTVIRSTIWGNSAFFGGGFSNTGTLTVTLSTISGNVAYSLNGADSAGGAIYNSVFGETRVTQSTISGNTSIGNISSPTVAIFDDSQGLFNDGTVTLTQTIVASNSLGNCGGSITDGGYNLEDSNGCGFSQSTSLFYTNPGLGPLQDNGGPTFTHAITRGSLAINAGPTTCLISGQSSAVDQRGVLRPQLTACDIGAYEFIPQASGLKVAHASGVSRESTSLVATLTEGCGAPVYDAIVSFTLNGIPVGSARTDGSGVALLRRVSLAGIEAGTYPTGVGASFAGDASFQASSNTASLNVAISGTAVACDTAALIAAIDSANTAGGGTLELSPGCAYTITQPSTPNGLNGLPPITTSITIHGNGATITRGGTNPSRFRIFEVDRTGTLAIDHVTVSGGDSNSDGGGILNVGELMVTQSTIANNIGGVGGGIHNGGYAELTKSTISGNRAFSGGGIFNSNNGMVTVTQSTISGNVASFGGGLSTTGTVTVTQSTISGNLAESDGGAIYNSGPGEMTVTQSTISGNSASGVGVGGIFDSQGNFDPGTVTLSRSIIANNALRNCAGSITDGGYNLENATSCGFSQSTSLTNTNPGLGPLQDNGGPTLTHALSPGSPAIDKGTSAGLTTDQRGTGFPRTFDDPNIPNAPGGDGTDIGAFELSPSSDGDNDGVPDATDNCPLDANPNQGDGDGDGIGDACDPNPNDGPTGDLDGDGARNNVDNCPTTANADQIDTDGDAEGDACDADDDNDGVPDATDNCPLNANSNQSDGDSDGLGDACDPNPNDGPTGDLDGDGVRNNVDNCSLTPNSDQANNDGDAQGDVCDPDDDNDGVADAFDNCRFDANPNQANNDGDTLGDVCDPDDDNDGVPDNVDNCPLVANPSQANADGDALGDACDPTPNGDIQIVFSSNRDGNFEIYGMRADGAGVVRLTNNGASDLDPSLSPDKTRIVFTSNRDGNFEIYVMNANGTGVTRLTNNSAIEGFAAWSPTGAKIAFTSTRDGNSEIYSMNANGTGVTRLTTHSKIDGNPSWSPDGIKIAFVSTRHGNFEIYSMNANGTGVTRLTNHEEEDAFPTWSLDSAKIAFMSTRPGNAEIYVMNANGSGLMRLTTNSAIDAEPAWNSNGRIAFTSTRNGNSEIYSMNAAGTGLVRLTNHSAWDISPHW